jgi:diacylglycerol O-acyltransferase / wax synthase
MRRLRRETMAPVDAAWLRMEDPTNLMMITGVLIFDTPLDERRFRLMIEQRLVARFDRFRMRAVLPAGGLASPYWEEDEHFTLDAHIHRLALPAPGGQAALEDLTSDLMSTPLDFSKPPWQFHLVEGYGAGSALIARLHHSIADGIALVFVLLSLTDTAAASPLQAPSPDITQNPLAPIVRAAESAIRDVSQFVESPSWLGELARVGAAVPAALGKLVFQTPDPPTMLKGPRGVQKRASWSQPIPLELVKAIGAVAGATINDILLAAVAGSLRRYLLDHGAAIDGLNIRAVVPVNLRPLDQPPTMGNQFGVVFLSLPIGIADPYDRLTELRERMDTIKGSPEAVVAFGILSAMGRAPEALQDIGVSLFGSKATAVMTNVPGPRQTIYMAGSAIRQIIFWVPQSGHLSLGVSIISYAGHITIGFAVDTALIPEPERFIEGFHQEIESLRGLLK